MAMGLLWCVTMATRLPWLRGGCEREDFGSSPDRLTCPSEVQALRRWFQTASTHLEYNNKVWETRACACVRVTLHEAGVNCVCSQVSSFKSVCARPCTRSRLSHLMNLSGSGCMHSGHIEIVCMHIQICTLYTLQLHVRWTRDALRVQSLSLRNVSSTDGSGSTMSGSLSMLRPSRLRGSMRSSSSNGKPPSESKHSGTVHSALLMSFDRLGLESSEREGNRWWWVNVFSCSENTSSRYNSQCRCTHRCPDSSFLDKSDADRKRHNISCCSRKPKLEPEAAKFMDACSSPFWEKCQTATIDSWETRRSADARLWFQPQERITNLTTHSC